MLSQSKSVRLSDADIDTNKRTGSSFYLYIPWAKGSLPASPRTWRDLWLPRRGKSFVRKGLDEVGRVSTFSIKDTSYRRFNGDCKRTDDDMRKRRHAHSFTLLKAITHAQKYKVSQNYYCYIPACWNCRPSRIERHLGKNISSFTLLFHFFFIIIISPKLQPRCKIVQPGVIKTL